MTDSIPINRLLLTIGRVNFISRSGPASRCAWSGTGEGHVETQPLADGVRFHERGIFRLEGQPQAVSFINIYRWEHHPDGLRLFHERRGADQAVWLFDLQETSPGGDWCCVQPHLCGEDRYTARLSPLQENGTYGFELHWRITGPRKDEHLYYRYRQ